MVLSSLETRFKFSSIEVGSIGLTSDVGTMVFIVLVSYFGERGNKPRWLAVSLVVQGLACLLYALPQWTFGKYNPESVAALQTLCLAEPSIEDALDVECSTANYTALIIFMIASFLLGAGPAPLFTLGVSFLDDIVRPKYVPLYMGFFFCTLTIGPLFGFAIGGVFLRYYVDFGEETELSPDDPAWVGAWWMCFVIPGALYLLLSVPFFMFPRQVPGTAAIREERKKEMARVLSDDLTHEATFKEKLKMLPSHLKTLLLNRPYVCICLFTTANFLLVGGIVAFSHKYLRTQFSLTESTASFVVGFHSIAGSGQ